MKRVNRPPGRIKFYGKRRLVGSLARTGSRRCANPQKGKFLLHRARRLAGAWKADALYTLLRRLPYRSRQMRTSAGRADALAALKLAVRFFARRDGREPEDDARLCALALACGRVADIAGTVRIPVPLDPVITGCGPEPVMAPQDDDALRHSAGTQVRRGSRFFSPEMAARFRGNRMMSQALGRTAWTLAKAGIFSIALDLVEVVGDGESYGVLPVIALAMAKAGRLEEAQAIFARALEAAERIEYGFHRSDALAVIAEAMAETGMAEAAKGVLGHALDLVQGFDGGLEKSLGLFMIAMALAETESLKNREGLFARMLEMAEAIEDRGDKSDTLADIAGAMAEAGMTEEAKGAFGEALGLAEGIEPDWKKVQALCWITDKTRLLEGIENRESLLARALEVAEGIKDGSEKSHALGWIVSRMAGARMFDRALRVAGEVEDSREKSQALTKISKALAKVGMTERAQGVLARALDVAEAIKDDGDKLKALVLIAGAMPQSGLAEDVGVVFGLALELAEGIGEDREKAHALKTIAEEMALAEGLENREELLARVLTAADELDDNENGLVFSWLASFPAGRTALLLCLRSGHAPRLIEDTNRRLVNAFLYLEEPTDSDAACLRCVMTIRPEDALSSGSGTLALTLLHLRSGHSEAFNAIVRECPEFGLPPLDARHSP